MTQPKASAGMDPHTGVPLPNAVLHIVDAEFHLASDIGVVWLAMFGSAPLQAAGYGMVGDAQRVVLTAAENQQVRARLLQLMQARPEYAGQTIT